MLATEELQNSMKLCSLKDSQFRQGVTAKLVHALKASHHLKSNSILLVIELGFMVCMSNQN